jgi:hypothetical protein
MDSRTEAELRFQITGLIVPDRKLSDTKQSIFVAPCVYS